MSKKRITVFTPTYNRAYIIGKLYESLKRQTYKDFEWIVIDDGSEDNTETVLNKFKKENPGFEIIYIRTVNGGKHRAINKGIHIARGELFFIADSDDYLTDDALEIVDKVEKSIPLDEKEVFAGVCGQDGYDIDTPVGTTFHGVEYLDISSLERTKYSINGDKKEVFYTEVLKKYPFPEFEGEKFLGEAIVWNRIAHDGYKLRFFNKIIYLCDYLEDGLSVNNGKYLKESAKGWALSINQDIAFGILKGIDKWRARYGYYGTMRTVLSIPEMAKNLEMNSLFFYLRMTGMRIFYKIYR